MKKYMPCRCETPFPELPSSFQKLIYGFRCSLLQCSSNFSSFQDFQVPDAFENRAPKNSNGLSSFRHLPTMMLKEETERSCTPLSPTARREAINGWCPIGWLMTWDFCIFLPPERKSMAVSWDYNGMNDIGGAPNLAKLVYRLCELGLMAIATIVNVVIVTTL